MTWQWVASSARSVSMKASAHGDVPPGPSGVSVGRSKMPVMADRSPVLRIITSAARESLKPLGLAQRGRSRLWIDDHGWWLGVVEFTPSRTVGSGLHVGAMWLWQDVDHLAFHPVTFA